ncbi:MAG TPA: glycosyltransferase family 39 protein, partial [Terrimicrobiaceae bacterium]
MSSRHSWQLPGVVALSLVLTLGTAGWGSLYNETDGQYGGAGKVMARNGSWLIPENDGIPRLVKPPLLYWAIAVSMKMFGINEFAARVPNALAVVTWVAATYLIGRRMGGDWRGLLAAIILLTSVGTFTLGRIIMPEIMFSAFVAAALYSGIRAADSTHH